MLEPGRHVEVPLRGVSKKSNIDNIITKVSEDGKVKQSPSFLVKINTPARDVAP